MAEQQPDSGWLNNQTESGWLEILVVVIADNNLPVIQISSHLTAAVSFWLARQQPSGGWLSNQTESGWLEILVVVITDNNLPVIQISSGLRLGGCHSAVAIFCKTHFFAVPWPQPGRKISVLLHRIVPSAGIAC